MVLQAHLKKHIIALGGWLLMYTSGPPPPVWQKTTLFPDFFLLPSLSRSSKNSLVSMILASRPTYRTSPERGQRRASSGDDNDDDKYAHKYTNTQIQRQIQDRKGLRAEKAIHVAYFRNSESARISNMIFSVHHQSITQNQIQRRRK